MVSFQLSHCSAYITYILFIGGILAFLYHRRLRIQAAPLPKIPYNPQSASRWLGDLPDLAKAAHRGVWIWNQPKQHRSPLAQLFIHPLEKPTVVVTDYREVVDICSRRVKEFDRGSRNRECVELTAPNFHLVLESRDPRLKAQKELLKDLMSRPFLNDVAAPRLYDKARSLIQLWTMKMEKGRGCPFRVDHDFHLAVLDSICSVAWGLEEEKEALCREARHLEAFSPDIPPEGDDPVNFVNAPMDPDMAALVNMSDMIDMAQRCPFHFLSFFAMLRPKNAKAWWHRRRLVYRQTTKRVERLRRGMPLDCALDQLLRREESAAEKAGREPDFYSPIIRDEVSVGTPDFSWHLTLSAPWIPPRRA